jgi:hypothetical protein
MKESQIGIPVQPQGVIVTVTTDYANRVEEVAADLEKSGLKVRDVLANVGTISGDVSNASVIPNLEKVAGVRRVIRSFMKPTPWSPR